MKIKIVTTFLFIGIILNLCSCTFFKNPIDKKTGFSNNLSQMENYIRSEDWSHAKTSLEDTKKSWQKLKPLLQVDIDHDYVFNIENDLSKLAGYIDTKEKPDSLSTILLIKDIWEDIESF